MGKVLDPSVKPVTFIINKGSPGQIVIGPNKIMYIQESGQFKVMLPESYNGKQMSQVLFNNS